jgi:Baseplate hub gp41
MSYTNPHYPRKYEIVLDNKKGKTLNVSDLHCSFRVEKRPNKSANFASLVIYNLNEQTSDAIFGQASKEGIGVTINAGYENGDYGQIFKGDVWQPLYDRENVTDYKLELVCLDGSSLLHGNYAKFSLGAGYKYSDLLIMMCKSSHTPIPIGTITSDLGTQQSTRGITYAGDPWTAIADIAKDNNALAHVLDGELHIQKITDPSGQEIVISPSTGLIGTPQQSDYGFSFRALLTPKIALTHPWTLVKIDNSIIRQNKALPSESAGSYVSMLDKDMSGIVIEATYIGDTRGQEWYVDAVCANKGGKSALGNSGIPEMIQSSSIYNVN